VVPVLEFEHVAKKFILHPTRPRSLQEMVIAWLRRQRAERREFWVLRDISLTVERGEVVGVIGDNGTGKSTMLKLAARIIEPTRGQVTVNGRVGALLELGVGFHPDLTGRENIYLSAALVGLSRREILPLVEEIIAFSGIGEFIDVPVRHYSSGMLVRLGFSVATSIKPDILLVDEVLVVGDQTFRQQCVQRIEEMRAEGTAILYVSHNLDEIRRICDRALWLDEGIIQVEGHPDEVVQAYMNHTLRERQLKVRALGDEQRRGWHLGSGEVEITGIFTLDGEGGLCDTFVSGSPFVVRIDYRCRQPVSAMAFGLSIYTEDGIWVTSPNSIAQADRLASGPSGSVYYVVESLPLRAGTYEITAAVFDPTAPEYKPYDHLHRVHRFTVREGAVPQDGLVELPHRWLDEGEWTRLHDHREKVGYG